jgi:hypothetical protein
MGGVVTETDLRCELPPLILHPFSEPSGPEKLAASSRASLTLQGVLPSNDLTVEELECQLLEGRYCELSMLFYIGKDLLRWADQCMELVNRSEGLRNQGIRCESFLQMIVENPPAPVDRKLQQWGVHEYKTIFSRAVGIHAIFGELPDPHTLRAEFVRHYHRFADHLFVCRQQLLPFTPLPSASFDFALYSSAEYAQMLEREWGAE